MLDQFIESKSNSLEKRRTRRFLFSTFSLLTMFCFSAIVWSLFARELALASGDLEFAMLVAPIAEIEAVVKKEEEPEPKNKPAEENPSRSNLQSRIADISRIEDNFVAPEKVSTTPNTSRQRPKNGEFIISGVDSDGPLRRNLNEKNVVSKPPATVIPKFIDDSKDELPPSLVKKPIVATIEKKPVTVSLGVANGKAISLPKPPYNAAAKAVGAGGTVLVQILIDENGNVTSASATSGHPLLRADCERAARLTKFSPTFLSKVAVKATGILTYNFIR